MARTSAKAKKQKQEAKSKTESTTQNTNEIEQPENSENGNENTSDSTDKENENLNYEVEKIVHTRLYHGKRQYLVRWKGYKEDSDTWENESVLHSCGDALETFKKENPTLEDKSKDDSDEAGDEESQDSEGEEKAKKRTKKETSKKPNKKVKKTKSSKAKKDNQDTHASTQEEDEEEETQKKETEDKVKDKSKEAKKVSAKKPKVVTEESGNDNDKSVTDDKNYEVEKILEVHTRKDGSREFLIRWKGYRPSDDTWEPEAHLDCQEMIEKFMEKVDKAKSIPARELRESRTPTNRYIPNTKVKGQRSNLRNAGFRPSYQE